MKLEVVQSKRQQNWFDGTKRHQSPSRQPRERPSNQYSTTENWDKVESTLQGINISYLGKRKIIFKSAFLWDMLVPRRVPHPVVKESPTTWTLKNTTGILGGSKFLDPINMIICLSAQIPSLGSLSEEYLSHGHVQPEWKSAVGYGIYIYVILLCISIIFYNHKYHKYMLKICASF